MAINRSNELEGLVQFLAHVNRLGKRGMRAALASQPKCRLGMLEHLHTMIEQHGHDGTIYVSELAKNLQQSMPAVSRGLRYLEQDGHIRRETDPHDRRKTLVCITPEGEAARLAGEQAINAYVARIMDRISPDDLARMLTMKDVFLAAIEAENEALEQNLKTGGTPYDTDL